MVGLSACVKPPTNLPDDPTLSSISDPAARRELRRGKPVAASDIYSRRAAKTSDPAEREDFLLIAAEILFDRAMYDEGAIRLQAVPEVLGNTDRQARRAILVAKQLLHNNDAEAALLALPNPDEIESALHRARTFETQAMAYKTLEDPGNELYARIQLEEQLDSPAIVERNHNAIWQRLTTLPISTLNGMTTSVRGDTYQGWIELALSNAESNGNPAGRTDALRRWQERFPTHPANQQFIANLYNPDEPGFVEFNNGPIRQIAVLLPISDPRTAQVAAAIRDGMIAAHQSDTRPELPTLRFYDIGTNPGYVRTAYEAAVADGADAIVGPLRKEAVAAVVTQRQIPLPTITLNTVDSGIVQGENIIQFGLAPEDEAHSAASRAIALSLRNAVVLQADDSRGDRETRAFQETMFRYGGDVVHVAVLPADKYDYSEEIKNALQITQSDQRFRSLSNAIGEKLFFEPSIRNDVDVIFLAVSSEQARSIRPQLDFFHATQVPRFGTSRVAALGDDLKKNKDLNSIYYPDAPWVLRKSLRSDPVRQEIIKNFPGADSVFAKIYALGLDAYAVTTNLDLLSSGQRLSGYTGDLELTSDGRIQRYLDWAQYQEGKSVGIEAIQAEPLQSIQPGS